MSLGPSPDSALVGRTLDLRFPLQGDAREIGGSLCLAVDVRYGDDRISDSTATLEDGVGDLRFVRVRTTVPVNEPIVSVRLQAGCEQPLSRSYTLLAGAPLQTTLPSGALPPGTASSSAIAPSRVPSRALPPEGGGSRASGSSGTGRAAAPTRSSSNPTAPASPVRPRAASTAPRAETGAAANPRSAQGPIASSKAPARSGAQPILQLEDPAYFRQSPEASKQAETSAARPAAPIDERQRTAVEGERSGGSAPETLPTASPAAPAAVPEDQVALMRAELAAARKEIARLQAAVTERTAPPAEETDYRPYLIAALGALVAAAAGTWALRRNRRRKAEAGAWWHGSHSVQAPMPSQAGFTASVAGHTDLGSVAAHDLAYPVSMLPEDLERSSMFPDFLRQDARSAASPHGEASVTLPGEPAEPASHPTTVAREASVPVAAMATVAPTATPAATLAPRFEPSVSPAASIPSVAAPAASSETAAYWKEEPKYRELDLDLDVGSGEDAPPLAAAQAPAPAAPTRLDEGNLIDFESSELGGFLKPSSRERQD